MSDNQILNVSGDSLSRLKTAMSLADRESAIGWSIQDGRMIFFWTSHESMHPFPVEMPMDRCAEIAMEWLKTAKYPTEPGHDGDNERGWRCFTEEWGHVSHMYQAFVAVEPYWLMFGK